jgi:hypothetical protein
MYTIVVTKILHHVTTPMTGKRPSNASNAANAARVSAAKRKQIQATVQTLERQLANIRKIQAMQYRVSKLGIRK